MAVKIDRIDEINDLGSKINSFSESIKSASSGAQTSYAQKIDGSESEAVAQFENVMNQLKATAFSSLPEVTSNFSTILNDYCSKLQGAGFTDKIKSTKPVVEEEYCQRVSTAEIEKFSDEALEIKKVINEIAAVVSGVSASKINSAKFERSVTKKLTAIKTTRSTVQSAQTTFKSKLAEVTTQLSECTSLIENIMNLSDPSSGLNPAAFMSLISSGNGELITTLTQSPEMKKDDIKAMNYLVKGDYNKLFALDPNNLHDLTYGILVNQITDMVHLPNGKGAVNQKELQNLINSLLKQSEGRIEGHAFRILTMNDLMTLQYSGLLAAGDELWSNVYLSDVNKINADKALLSQKVKKLQALSGLWETLIVIDTPEKKSGIELGHHSVKVIETMTYKISNLTLASNGDFEFNLKTNGTSNTGSKSFDFETTKTVRSVLNEDALSQTDANIRKRINEIRQERIKAVENAITSISTQIMGLAVPGMDALIAAAIAAEEKKLLESGAEVSGALKVDEKKFGILAKGQSISKELFSAAQTIEDVYSTWNDLDAEDAAERRKLLNNLLNAGGKETKVDGKTVFTGTTVPTAEVQMRLDELNNHGYMNYAQAKTIEKGDIGEYNYVAALEKLYNNEPELTREHEYLVYGNKGPNKVELKDLNLEEFTSERDIWLGEIGLDGTDASNWLHQTAEERQKTLNDEKEPK